LFRFVPLLLTSLYTAARSLGGRLVPADIVLLNGACIVNEAMLTGEAVPQTKEALGHEPAETDSAPLAALPNPRVHLLFAGTEIVQVTHVAKQVRSWEVGLIFHRRS
jgi:cation-transporting ATPase 13A1